MKTSDHPGVAKLASGQEAADARKAFDTSGDVYVEAGPHKGQIFMWRNLSPFAQGYIEALFASIDRDFMGEPRFEVTAKPEGVGKLFLNVGFSDLSPETLAAILRDCEIAENEWSFLPGRDGGVELWKGRQQGAYIAWSILTPYLGDDGKVYLRAADAAGNPRTPESAELGLEGQDHE
jgi:hypothetical protein